MNVLFKSAVVTPNITLKKNHILPVLEDRPNSFSHFDPVEAQYPISYTIQTVGLELLKFPIRL